MPLFWENLLSARVRTANVIFAVIAFAFVFNVTVLPIYVITHPKSVNPELSAKVIDFATNGLVGIVMFIMGRIIATKSEGTEK